MNLTGVYPNLSRAYEIALLGRHTITVVYLGNLFNYTQANEDYPMIKKFFSGVLFVSNGDLWIEIKKPQNYDQGKYSETLTDIHTRVKKAENNTEPKQEYCDTGKELLKNAVDHLLLSLKDVEIIQRVSSTIAKLDGEGEILVHHVVEAIQYRIKPDHPLIIAENNTIQFGGNISIKQGEINYGDIENAINYLGKML